MKSFRAFIERKKSPITLELIFLNRLTRPECFLAHFNSLSYVLFLWSFCHICMLMRSVERQESNQVAFFLLECSASVILHPSYLMQISCTLIFILTSQNDLTTTGLDVRLRVL